MRRRSHPLLTPQRFEPRSIQCARVRVCARMSTEIHGRARTHRACVHVAEGYMCCALDRGVLVRNGHSKTDVFMMLNGGTVADTILTYA